MTICHMIEQQSDHHCSLCKDGECFILAISLTKVPEPGGVKLDTVLRLKMSP